MAFSWLAGLAGGARGATDGLDDVIAQRNHDDEVARTVAREQQEQANADRSARIEETLASLQLLGSGKFRMSTAPGVAPIGNAVAAPVAGVAPSPDAEAAPPAAATGPVAGMPPGPRSGGNIGTPTAIPTPSVRGPAMAPPAAAGSGLPAASPVRAAVAGSGFQPRLQDLEPIPQDEQDARTIGLDSARTAAEARARAPYEPWHPKTMAEALAVYQAEHPGHAAAAASATSPLVHRATLIKGQLQDTRSSITAEQKIVDNGLPRHATASDSAAMRSVKSSLAALHQRHDSLTTALDQVGAAMAAGGAAAPAAAASPVPAPDTSGAEYADAAQRYKEALAAGANPDQARSAYNAVVTRIAQRHGQAP
jgi:hypothetical protein